MAGRLLEFALSIKGKIDDSLPASVKKAASSVEDLNDEFDRLIKTQKNADAYERIQKSIGSLNAELAKANQKMIGANTATSEGKKQFDDAKAAAESLAKAIAAEEMNLTKVGTALENAGFKTKDFAESQKQLNTAISASMKVKKLQNDVAVSRKNNNAAKNSLVLSSVNLQSGVNVAKVLTSPLVEATQAAMTFESAMADVRKVVDFDTPQQFTQMGDAILALSQKIPMTAEGIAQIVAAGGQAGIAKEDLLEFATAAAKMSVAFDISASQAGDMMAQWRSAFKMNQTEVESLADKINYLGNTTAASAPKISDVVTRIGPLGEIGGVASGEIAALGASMVATGVQSDVAATGIKNLILGMVAGETATKSQQEAFAQLGMSATDVAQRMQVDAKGAILDVMKAIQALPKESQAGVLSRLFGKESIEAISPLLSNLDALEDNFDKVADSVKYAGSVEQEYAARSKTAANRMQLLENGVKALKVSIGNALLPTLTSLMTAAAPIIQGISDWVSRNQELVSAIVAVGAAVGGMILAFLGLSFVASLISYLQSSMALFHAELKAGIGVVGKLTKGIGLLPTLLSSLSGGLSAVAGIVGSIGFGPILLAIGAIVAVVMLLSANFDQLENVAMIVWNHISGTISAYAAVISAAFQQALDTITQVWNSITGQSLASSELIGAIFNELGFAIGAAFDIALGIVTTSITVIAGLVSSIVQTVGDVIGLITALFNGDWASAWNYAKQIVMDVIDAISGAFHRITDGVSNIIRTLRGEASDVQEQAEAQGSKKVGHNARGGIYRKGAFLTTFAEDSAEAAIPLDNSARAVSLWEQAGHILGTIPGNAEAGPSPVAVAPVSNRNTDVKLDFKPTINIQGNATPDVVDMIRQALNEQARQFEEALPRMIDDINANKRRLSYE